MVKKQQGKCGKCGRKVLIPSVFEGQKLCAVCHSNAKNSQKPRTRQITETKATCKACGNVWFYGKLDSIEQMGNASSNCGKSMMCCTCSPCALFIPDNKVTDLNKCPKCNSKAVVKEKVTHDV